MSKKAKNDNTEEEKEVNNLVEEVQTTSEVSLEEQLQEELIKEKEKFLRLFAEFENYKKRTSKERIDLFKTAGQDVMLSLLPILDDFDRAYSEMSKTTEKELLKGIELISQKLKSTLQQKGLKEVKVKKGDTFDAEDHEAITQIPAPSKELKGKIIDILEKGYKLGDKVIRYPKVVIGQ